MKGLRVARLLEAGCCLLVFVATLELCVRLESVYRWGAPFWGDYSLESLRSSGTKGYFNRPGARFEKWQINSAGFRGPEIAVEKPPGVVRVGVVGASEIFGLYETPGKEVTAQLQDLLNSRARQRFEVVNLAAPGMSPPRIGELFERWAGKFGFDVVVVYSHPALYLDADPPRRQSPGHSTDRPPARVSLRLPERAWRMARERLPQTLQDALKTIAIERERRRHAAGWVWDSLPSERLALFADDMTAAVEALQQRHIRVVLVTHASRFGASLDGNDQRALLAWDRFYPRASTKCLLEMDTRGNEVVRQIGAAMRVPVIDLAESMGGQSGYFADFSHFTDEGAKQVADAMARQVVLVGGEAKPTLDESWPR